ncbi:hypothetical protein EYZ11_003356 [Aspergillus tanneri]|uniref:Uncharacterized protein n=1 Tax=Aspergillus tanneri TaxID=1220188 RepID=A0A4S3JTM2_9EURO|nr:hypothetical protein EYZ11_003356 [Aspergillus tanneri]
MAKFCFQTLEKNLLESRTWFPGGILLRQRHLDTLYLL